jgi:Arc/MetJ-type ribon-helix-helix transcriptional regulator
MWYIAIMAARSVQISLDEELLREIDRRPETKRDGRSAVIKRALQLYLDRKRRETIDETYARAYGSGSRARGTGTVTGTGGTVRTRPERANEFDALLDTQAWPEEP